MSKSNASKLFEWLSYLFIAGATAAFFLTHKDVAITLLLLIIAVYMRALMYRTKYHICQEENEELMKDLKQAASLLRQREKKDTKTEN